jgi:carboxypeptidase Taq
MPHAAAEHRANQQEMVARLVHERQTSARLGELLSTCERDPAIRSDAAGAEAANVREMRRDYDHATRLPTELVAEIARVSSLAQEAWKAARERDDFGQFEPWLEKMMGLMRRKAECFEVKPGGELYDALLDEYEPGATARQVEMIFKPLAERLRGLIDNLLTRGKRPADSFVHVKFAADRQHEMGQFVLRAMGFDFGAGRLDVTTHPFCSGVAPGDTRLTTRYRDEKFTDALYGTMHEGGHGLYEQGLPKLGNLARWGEPLANSISLGIHESQSRMWENFVGRSREFWRWLLPHAQKFAHGAMDRYSPDDAYRAVNTVSQSFIRVESDEATYNLHVLLRFEIERRLISGDMRVRDVPGEWNKRFKELLGVDVPDNRRGCLQDVHWSFGLVGYFPTYTLGNLYAAQFWETIHAQMPDLSAQMSRGEFLGLKSWLNKNIHCHGRRYGAEELCKRITGKPLGHDALMRHLEGKLNAVYGL